MSLPWTHNQDELLINMVNAGASVNDLAIAVGKSKDAILSRIKRLKTAGKIDPLLKLPRPKAAPKKTKPPTYKMPERIIHPLEQLGHRDCRWPFGDPRKAGFQFCGKQIEPGLIGPYCLEHSEKAFNGSAPRPKELEPA